MEYINADFEGKLEIPVELFTKSGREEMIDNLKNLDRNVATTVDLTIGATWRAGSSALDYKRFAEAGEKQYINGEVNPYYNEYSHQHANIHFSEHVGNGAISGSARAASEFLYQFPVYTAEDLIRRTVPGGEPYGKYQPYSFSPNASGGIFDSFEDIGISSGIIDRRQKYNYNKTEFEQKFNQWKNENYN